MLFATRYGVVDLTDDTSQTEAIREWEKLTAHGGEGTVIKPLNFIVQGKRGLVQPAVKCRGREYLRIIYGPEYTLPQNLERLRSRGVSHKRSLALESLLWVLRHSSVSLVVSRCLVSTSVFSACLHWKVRLLIQDSEINFPTGWRVWKRKYFLPCSERCLNRGFI